MLTALALILVTPFITLDATAQVKRPLDHEAVENWNRISGVELSRDGNWVLWEVGPEEKDGRLRIKSTLSATEYEVNRGEAGVFSGNGLYAAFKIVPVMDSVRTAKLAKKKSKDMPKDNLGIMDLNTGSIDQFERVLSFKLPEERGNRIAFRLVKDESKPDSTEADKSEEEEEDEDDEEEKKDEGTTLVVLDLESGTETRVEDVTDYEFSKDGAWLAYIRSNKEGDVDGVYVLPEGSSDAAEVLIGEGNYKQLAMDDRSAQLAFLSNNRDFESDQPHYTLYRASLGESAFVIAGPGVDGLSDGWWVSEHGSVYFSDSGKNLFFGTAPIPDPEPDDDDVLDEEKVKVDVWSWTDPLLQPNQLVQLENEQKRTYLAVAMQGKDGIIQLGNELIPTVVVSDEGDGSVALGTSNLPYRQEISWDSPGYMDAYQIDVRTGSHQQILTRIQDRIQLSPSGNYVYWWDRDELVWRGISTESGEPAKLSGAIPTRLDNELHDWPYKPNSYGLAGWSENDSRVLFYDKYDIWAVEPHGDTPPQNITDGLGREQNLRFRIIDLDPEEAALASDEDLLLSVLDYSTKNGGFYRDKINGKKNPEKIVMGPSVWGTPRKAKEADVLILTSQSFTDFPDYYATDVKMTEFRPISNANPQQDEYTWGTSELYSWTSTDGQRLDGILYKPDDFDPSRKYPMMVYFYEKNSNNLNRHHAPRAGSSSISYSFYVSRGYLLFVPDIPYKVGYPGESAVNAVMPGITSLIGEGFVDAKRIGVQGHSWGGYQIAYMVTQTNLFAAAEAGAPVSNMTSAYGGIRWGSGLSRMMQYEQSQSRIGGTLWNALQKYIHNSPLFQADKVETPLLIMHNDEDGAVPWYQGIEYFVALRRLGRPVWMLNYNGEAHGLRQYKNRKDWSIRMQQFFDHYLKGDPAPVWLKEGVPAIKKGKTLGLEIAGEPVAGRGSKN
ncbi:MAG: prolyl oligopeptidase family serine peptidase [Rhodothermia bacterium]|nr:MAG: prolyl oligopeptidase family serine peptidase [Rhodothermia bacterium]